MATALVKRGIPARSRVRVAATMAILSLLASTVAISPVSAATITAANDVDITQVVLDDNGTIVTQTSTIRSI